METREVQQLQDLVADAETRIASREADIQAQMDALDRDRRVLDALRQALNAITGEPSTQTDSNNGGVVRHHSHVVAFMQSLEDLLRSVPRPLHVSELRAELVRRGIPIPGRGDEANVIVHLRKCPNVVQTARGTYAYRSLGYADIRTPDDSRDPHAS